MVQRIREKYPKEASRVDQQIERESPHALISQFFLENPQLTHQFDDLMGLDEIKKVSTPEQVESLDALRNTILKERDEKQKKVDEKIKKISDLAEDTAKTAPEAFAEFAGGVLDEIGPKKIDVQMDIKLITEMVELKPSLDQKIYDREKSNYLKKNTWW